MTQRLRATFAACQARERPALVTYVMAGDPDLPGSLEIALACAHGGADIIELGVPFSDPIADGPVIQRAAERSLAAGTTLASCLELASQIRRQLASKPLALMGYLNPILAMGPDAFFARCAEAAVDAAIIPDLPLEEAGALRALALLHGVGMVFLIAPTSPPARAQAALDASTAFAYFVSVTGVTGARAELPPETADRLDDLHRPGGPPVVVGFGVSTAEQVRALGAHADGVVVGSAIVSRAAEPGTTLERAARVEAFVRSLRPTSDTDEDPAMLIVMKPHAAPGEVEAVNERIRSLGLTPHSIPGAQRVAIGITGNKGGLEPEPFISLPGVADVIRVSQPFKLVSREVKEEDSVIDIAGVPVGGPEVMVMAGPCSVESKEQILEAAAGVRAAGARFLRGGAFKPRTSPYEFQGLKEEGLKLLALARDATGLKVVTEVKDTETLPMVAEYSDVLQVGARNMQNYSLLEALGNLRKPVLLKRGLSATIKELLMAAEYILARGNYQVMLCERGIRTYETMTRNTLDINAVPVLKGLTHLPVLVDPSHGIGLRKHVAAVARAGVAAGADGLIIEVHPCPEKALSDGHQSLSVPEFDGLMRQVRGIASAIGRPVAGAV